MPTPITALFVYMPGFDLIIWQSLPTPFYQSGSALLLDPEGPGGCEGQFPPPPSLRQLETIVGPSDSLHGDQVSMELTCVEPHGESLQPVSNDGDHSMDADDFVAYEDHSNDLPQSVPRRLDDAAVELGNQALGEKLPTCDDSSVPTTYSSASGGVRDLVQRKCESLAVVDMSLDLSCTSSPRQPCIHPHLIDVVGGDRSANNQENSPIKNDMELEDGHLQTDASKDTSHAIQPDASNMSLTCQTPMLSRVGLLKVDGSEGTHTLQMQASNDTSHAIQPEVSNMSLIHQPLMLGRDEAPKENGGNVPADTLNHTTPPNSPSMSLTCEAPLHNGDGAQDTRHTTVLGSSQIDRDVVVVASMAQAPATFNSSVTELTCKIPAIPPLMPQDCSTGSHTSSNASPMSQGSHTVTPGNCLPDKDDADVQQEGRSRVLRQSPAGERPKTQLASVTTVKPPTVSTSTDDPPSRAQLSNSLPLSTSVAISDTHRLPKIGLTRQSKRIRPSTRALKKRISVPRSLTASKVSALAQVNYSASILHSSAAATLPYTDSALAPAVKDETASKADNLEHHAEAVGSGSEEEAAATSQGNRSASVKEMTQQDVKEDRIKHPQEVTEDIREGLPVDHVAEMGCERVTDYDSVQNGGHTGVQDRTDMSVQDNTCTSVQDRMDTSVQDRTRTCVQDRTDMFVQDRTRTCVQDRTDMFVQDRTNTSVQDKMDTSVKDKMDTSVKDKMDTSVQDRTDTSVQDRTRMCVQDRTHLCVQEGTDTSVQDRTHTSVQEGTHASMRVGQNTSVLEGEHRLTPSDEGIPRQKDECTPSFSKTYTLSTLPGGCLSPTDGQLESVTTVVGGSSNDSESRISAKQDEGESLCSSTTAPLDATREVPHRCRHLNRTYSISPDSSFFSAKEDDSWKEETFSSPLPVETASLVTVTAAPLPSGTTHLCPSPCLSEGNWMHGKDADISLVDSSMITLLADRTLTPQVQLKTTVGGNLEEEVKNAVAAPVCTALTTTTPPSDTGVNEQGISTERPTEDVGTTHRCHANPNDVSRCSVTEGTLNTTHRRHANPNDVSGCSVTEGTLNTTHRRHANPNDVSGCSIIEGTLNTTHRRHANPNDVSGCRVTEGTLNTTHRRHANPNDVSGCSVTEGTLNTTLQSAGYDSPLLQVFKTPGGGTPGTLLKSKISFVTTPWSARSSFTPIIPDRSTPGSTAPSRLWVDLPVLVTMENAPEFFNVDCAEVKALDKAEALKRCVTGVCVCVCVCVCVRVCVHVHTEQPSEYVCPYISRCIRM